MSARAALLLSMALKVDEYMLTHSGTLMVVYGTFFCLTFTSPPFPENKGPSVARWDVMMSQCAFTLTFTSSTPIHTALEA